MRRGDITARLLELEQGGLIRHRHRVDGPQGPHLQVNGEPCLAFCSNDYLGLASHPALADAVRAALDEYGVGAGASGHICGHTRVHEALEERLARFVRLPRALHFSTGYMANLGVLPALAGPGDAIFSDRLNHASLIDAARLSRADVVVYPHCDLDALDCQMHASEHRSKLVVTDAVFSMDGDLAPLPQLRALCERHDAWLVVDDAHGFGVLGESGAGSLAHWAVRSERIVYIGTLGKAAGVFGAFVAADADVVEWILQRARTYLFTTASPPLLAAALLAALDVIESESWRRRRLAALIDRISSGLSGLPWRLLPSTTAIQPLIIGDNSLAMSLMESLRRAGIWVPAIRPPTVPSGTARLRISLSAAHRDQDIDRLLNALGELGHREGAGARPT
ncbi:MAG TPA: 8-amino-7-oxononanoate synthase [Burkholderiaceae bacterium]|jgi:8-amino-7-oxononanoate synthase|nr:8-amino-7-oxononanoate synthase [Burkholderiaceae bacterium]